VVRLESMIEISLQFSTVGPERCGKVAKRRAIRAASKEDGFFDGEGDSALTCAGVILISELACVGLGGSSQFRLGYLSSAISLSVRPPNGRHQLVESGPHGQPVLPAPGFWMLVRVEPPMHHGCLHNEPRLRWSMGSTITRIQVKPTG
jgi:hypothetical protein